MKNLLSKNPHYVRCVKPNDSKAAGEFQDDLCRHQVRYLGYARTPSDHERTALGRTRSHARPCPFVCLTPISLLENVRVKRAGFCYRQKFDKFLERYKMVGAGPLARGPAATRPLTVAVITRPQLSKPTWPKFSGSAVDGCLAIVKAEKLLDAEYQVGRTKIFIRNPMTVRRIT